MSQQLYIPLSEEITEQLNSLANRYGMTAPLLAAELLRCIVSDESILKRINIKHSSLKELTELTISSAQNAPSGFTFMVNSFIEPEQWNLLSLGEKRTIAMALSLEVKKNPQNYKTLKAGGVNVYTRL